MVSAFGPGLMGGLNDCEGLLFGRAEGSEAALGGLDVALGFELVAESLLGHSLQYLGEAGEQGYRSEVGEGGGARDFWDWDHDSLLPLWREEGGVEGVGADEKEVVE